MKSHGDLDRRFVIKDEINCLDCYVCFPRKLLSAHVNKSQKITCSPVQHSRQMKTLWNLPAVF